MSRASSEGGSGFRSNGGPEGGGIFNKIEAEFAGSNGYPEITSWSSSWILAVDFEEKGPKSRGILTYSLSSNPESPHHAEQTEMFSRKEWLDLPFREEDVEAQTVRRTEVRGPRR